MPITIATAKEDKMKNFKEQLITRHLAKRIMKDEQNSTKRIIKLKSPLNSIGSSLRNSKSPKNNRYGSPRNLNRAEPCTFAFNKI